jgi:Tol biopolymer transport system component
MKHALILAVALSLISMEASVTLAQNGQDLFQKALVKERAEGDLEGAIAIYRQAVEHSGTDRALAARALLRIGQCYEKVGTDEAQKAYGQILQNYGDQADAVKMAQERLSALRKPDKKDGRELAVRKIWADSSTDTMGEVSPDGRYLSFVDWETGDLAIRDLETGKNRRLTNKGPWKESEDFALWSRWSPDGKQLAYDWYIGRPGATPRYAVELRVMTVANAKSRVLYRTRDEKEWIETADWSPNGAQIAVVRGTENNRNEIVLVSPADGQLRVLKTLGRQWPWPVLFSPDGRYLIYSYAPRASAPERDVFLLSMDGEQGSTLIDHPADDVVLGWSPDGKWTLFLSDRTGSLDLWAILVDGGKAQGDAKLVKPALGRAEQLGVTNDGAFYYGMTQRGMDVYVAKLDPQTGKVLAPPVKAVRRFEGVNDWPWYSPDGKYLAYVSARRSGARIHYSVLCIQSLETGEEREFPTQFRRLAGPRWAPDGRALIVATWDHNSRMSLCRVDVRTGEVSPVVTAGPDQVFRHHDILGDGTLVYVRADMKSQVASIIRRDLASGDEKELYQGPPKNDVTMALSPNGRRLAFINRPEGQVGAVLIVRVMPASGGEAREVVRFTSEGWFPLVWSADGRYLLFPRKMSPDDHDRNLWRVSADGGTPEKLDVRMVRMNDISSHPDGKQIAFGGSMEQRPAEVWMIVNLLQELKTPAK